MSRAIKYALFFFSMIFVVVFGTSGVFANDPVPTSEPRLVIDSGGHAGIIRALVFSRDGSQLVSAGDDKLIRVWDLAEGLSKRLIFGPSGPDEFGKIYALALSPDGKWLAVAADQRPYDNFPDTAYIRIFDFETGALTRSFKGGHTGSVLSLAFSSGGEALLSSSLDSSAILWDFASGEPLNRFIGHADSIYQAAFMADGQRVVTASDDKTLRLWNVQTGAQLAVLEGHERRVTRVAVSPRGDIIASGSDDGSVRLWRAEDGAVQNTLAQFANVVGGLDFDATGDILVTGTVARSDVYEEPMAWDIKTGTTATRYKPQRDDSIAVARTAASGRIAATAGPSGQIHVWNTATGRTIAVLKGVGGVVHGVSLANNGSWIGWGKTWHGESVAGRAWIDRRLSLEPDVLTGSRPLGPFTQMWSLPPPGLPLSISDPAGAKLALRHAPGGNFGFRSATLEILRDNQLSAKIIRDVSDGYRHNSYGFLPGGGSILSGGDNGALIEYDLSGDVLKRYFGHEGSIWSVASDRAGKLVASAGADQTVRLWNAQTAELVATIFDGGEAWCVWTPQGYYVASPSGARMVGWLAGAGADKQPNYFRASEMPGLDRADVVKEAIALGSAQRAANVAGAGRQKLPSIQDRIREWLTGSTR